MADALVQLRWLTSSFITGGISCLAITTGHHDRPAAPPRTVTLAAFQLRARRCLHEVRHTVCSHQVEPAGRPAGKTRLSMHTLSVSSTAAHQE